MAAYDHTSYDPNIRDAAQRVLDAHLADADNMCVCCGVPVPCAARRDAVAILAPEGAVVMAAESPMQDDGAQ